MLSGFRLALRALWRNPAPTFVIVLTLAVAIGVSTIIGSTVDSVWHALPVADTSRLIFVSSTDPRRVSVRDGDADRPRRAGARVHHSRDREPSRAVADSDHDRSQLSTRRWSHRRASRRAADRSLLARTVLGQA